MLHSQPMGVQQNTLSPGNPGVVLPDDPLNKKKALKRVKTLLCFVRNKPSINI